MIFNYHQILLLISSEPIITCDEASICMTYFLHLLIIVLLLLPLLDSRSGNNDVRVASDLMKQGGKQ